MQKSFIINAIEEEKLIVIVRGVEKDKLIPLTQAMFDGGIRLIEITYSADGKVSDEETAQNIKLLSEHFEGKMLVGAGTVLTEKQVELTKKAGGKFIISPDAYPEVIKATVKYGLVSIPGALTPTEIQLAKRCGADFVKLFPVTNLGASYINAIKAPLTNVKMLAVGGINQHNVSEYFNAGVCGFGVGSNITDKTMIKNNDWKGISGLAEKYVKAIRELS